MPTCIIVTGRPGAGKSTLAKKVGEHLRMPVVSRDEIKEGYGNTYGIPHNELPPETNGLVSDLFFGLVSQYLAGEVSIVIEAAFQHRVWESRLATIQELALVLMVVCSIDADTAAKRHLQRGLEDPNREFFHGDERVTHFKTTGEILPPYDYVTPQLDVPTIQVSTEEKYTPDIDGIVKWVHELTGRSG